MCPIQSHTRSAHSRDLKKIGMHLLKKTFAIYMPFPKIFFYLEDAHVKLDVIMPPYINL